MPELKYSEKRVIGIVMLVVGAVILLTAGSTEVIRYTAIFIMIVGLSVLVSSFRKYFVSNRHKASYHEHYDKDGLPRKLDEDGYPIIDDEDGSS